MIEWYMEVKNLMINDLVYEGKDKVIKVHHNYGRSIAYIDELDTKYYPAKTMREVEETCLSPIPLSEEILKANGWSAVPEYSNQSQEILDYYWSTSVNTYPLYLRQPSHGSKVWKVFNDKTISYVHELQHALRLCGMNELADNIKI